MKKIITILVLLMTFSVSSQVSPTNVWYTTGNSFQTNSNWLGTKSNNSLIFRTNNIQRTKIDSNGILTHSGSMSVKTITVTAGSAMDGIYMKGTIVSNGYLALTRSGLNTITTTTANGSGVFIGGGTGGQLMFASTTDGFTRRFMGTNTAHQNYTLPNATGTVALTSDINTATTLLVPYTSATQSVNLGAFDIQATNATFTGGVSLTTSGKGITFKTGAGQSAGTATLSSGTVTVSNSNVTATNCVVIPVLNTNTTISSLGVTYGSGSFTITSSNITDSREVRYTIIYYN